MQYYSNDLHQCQELPHRGQPAELLDWAVNQCPSLPLIHLAAGDRVVLSLGTLRYLVWIVKKREHAKVWGQHGYPSGSGRTFGV